MPLILFVNKKKAAHVATVVTDAIITTPSNDSSTVKAYVRINYETVSIANPAGLAITSKGVEYGKFYFEFKLLANYTAVGLSIANPASAIFRMDGSHDAFGVYMHPGGFNCQYTGCGYGAGLGFNIGDSLGVAVDMDTPKVDWYKLSGGNVTLLGTTTIDNCPQMATMPRPWFPCMANESGSTSAGTFNIYGPFINLPAGYSAYSLQTPDSIPNAFTFNSNMASGGAVVESSEVIIDGYNQALPISISGGLYRIKHNGVWGSYTASAGTLYPSDSVMVSVTAGSTLNSVVTATLTVGGVSGTYSVTTNDVFAKLSSTAHHSTISIINDTKATTTRGSWVAGRADKSIKSGKRYWEVRTGGGTYYGMVGIISASSTNIGMTTAGYLGANFNKSVGLYVLNGDGGYYKNYWTAYSGLTMTASDTIGFVLDYDAGTLTAYKNGVLFGVVISGIAEEVYPAYCLYNSTVNFTFNFGSSGFWNSIPAGCSPI